MSREPEHAGARRAGLNAAPCTNFIEGGPGTNGCFIDPGKDTALTCNP